MRIALTALVLVATLTLGACASHARPHADAAAPTGAPSPACPTCARASEGETQWCDKCNAGTINGKKVECKGCFDATQSGGACPTCPKK